MAARTCGKILLVAASVVLGPGVTAAQLGPDGTPIQNSDYTVDLTRGAVIGTSRVTGLAGAATSIAEGVEGGLQNPAAVAWRGPQWPEWYDYWLALGFIYPFDSGDFYNSGQVFEETAAFGDQDFFFLIPGAYWQMWNFGIGLTIDAQFVTINDIENPTSGDIDRLRLRFTTFHIQVGYGFLDGQLIIGGGLRILRQRAFLSNSLVASGDSFSTIGLGGEVGVIAQPHNKRWRLGASIYPKLSTGRRTRGGSSGDPNQDPQTFFLPDATTLPTNGNIGFSYQFGPRPPNPPWVSIEAFAADDLARLNRRKQQLAAAEADRIAAVRASGREDVELQVRTIEARYDAKNVELEEERKAIKKQAYKVLRNRFRNEWPRRYHLLTIDLEITGKLDNAVGVESFAYQIVQRSGQNVSVSPRVGYETEFWPRRMKGRFGTYVEPSRFEATAARVHFTFGLDINVLRWNVFGLWPDDYRWQISASFDVAAEYSAVSLGIGGWY